MQLCIEDLRQFLQPVPCLGGNGNDRGACKRRWCKRLRDLLTDKVKEIGLNEIRFRHDDDSSVNTQEVKNIQVFPRLRHDALISRNDEESKVDAANAGEHVLDETLVAWNIHNADLLTGGQAQPRKTEIDGHAALLFLTEAVRIDAGQCVDECGLAVIDVAGGTDDVHRTS